MNKITINRGSFKLGEVVIEQGTSTVGRATDNSIVLDDAAVSSHHAKIVTIFHTSYIEDLDSTNGTMINGKPVQKRTLHSGDVISLGNHQLLFQSDKIEQDTSEISETILLRGNEVKQRQRLDDYIQSQVELKPKDTAPSTASIPNGNKTQDLSAIGLSEKSGVFNIPDVVDNHAASSSTVGAADSLDKEKNRAWLEAGNASKNADTQSPVLAKPAATKATLAAQPDSSEPSPSAAPPPKPQSVRNTAEVLLTDENPNPSTPDEAPFEVAPAAATTVKRSGYQPSESAIDMEALARIAKERRRNRENGYAANGMVTLNSGRQRNKFMAAVWVIIVAALIAEVAYITYRTLA